MRSLQIVVTLTTLFILFVLGLALSDIWAEFLQFLQTMLDLIVIAGGVIILASAVFIIGWLVNKYQLYRLTTYRMERDNKLVVTVAKRDEQVYTTTVDDYHQRLVTTPLHLQPGRFNGGQPQFDREQNERWLIHQMAQAKLTSGKGDVPMLEASVQLPELLPFTLSAQRLLIGGGSDSGKSTLARHIIAGRSDGAVIVIDPHSPSKIMGYDVIGSGRDYQAIGNALHSLVLLMDKRYQDISAGLKSFGQHKKATVIIDELTSIVEQVPDAPILLKTLLTESRKVNLNLILLIHSLDTRTLGISAGIRASAQMVWLEGGNGSQHTSFVIPTGTGPAHSRKNWVEHRPPGPFAASQVPQDNVVLELPNAKILQAQAMHADGQSMTQITKAYFGLDRDPSGQERKTVRNLLERSRKVSEVAQQHHKTASGPFLT